MMNPTMTAPDGGQHEGQIRRGGLALKTYINDTLIPDVEDEIDDVVGAAVLGSIPDGILPSPNWRRRQSLARRRRRRVRRRTCS
jgi:hypothetical protein